jgi:hypothetical protein
MDDIESRDYARKELMYEINSRQTVCETLRLIYDEVYELPNDDRKEKIVELLIDGIMLAKKMQNRLRYYRETYNDHTGSDGESIKRIYGCKVRVKMRRARTI